MEIGTSDLISIFQWQYFLPINLAYFYLPSSPLLSGIILRWSEFIFTACVLAWDWYFHPTYLLNPFPLQHFWNCLVSAQVDTSSESDADDILILEVVQPPENTIADSHDRPDEEKRKETVSLLKELADNQHHSLVNYTDTSYLVDVWLESSH